MNPSIQTSLKFDNPKTILFISMIATLLPFNDSLAILPHKFHWRINLSTFVHWRHIRQRYSLTLFLLKYRGQSDSFSSSRLTGHKHLQKCKVRREKKAKKRSNAAGRHSVKRRLIGKVFDREIVAMVRQQWSKLNWSF